MPTDTHIFSHSLMTAVRAASREQRCCRGRCDWWLFFQKDVKDDTLNSVCLCMCVRFKFCRPNTWTLPEREREKEEEEGRGGWDGDIGRIYGCNNGISVAGPLTLRHFLSSSSHYEMDGPGGSKHSGIWAGEDGMLLCQSARRVQWLSFPSHRAKSPINYI